MSRLSKTMIDKKLLKKLSKVSAVQWILGACFDWCVIFAGFSLVYYLPNIYTVLLCILILGNRQHGLAILGHDGTHYRAHPNRKANELLTNFLCFNPLGLTNSGYRNLHNLHHTKSGTSEDPELMHKQSRSPQWDLPAHPMKILKYAALDLVGGSIADYKIIITFSKPNHSTQYIPLIFWHIVTTILCVYLGIWWVPVLWHLSLLTSFMMFFRFRLWLEHQGTSETHRLHLNILESTILAPHNAWLHWEHHNWPSIPYYNLRKARKNMPDTAIVTLQYLIEFYRNAPEIKSGAVLNN